jgi:hypothetical protein
MAQQFRSTERSVRPGSVDYFDEHFVEWRVTERDARRDPGTHGDWCLVFASESAIRRVWIYPTFWRTLSAAELEILSWMPGVPPRLRLELS